MLYAKAFAVGVVTGVLAPVVAGVASFGCAWVGGWPFTVLMSMQFRNTSRAYYFLFPYPGGPAVSLETCRFPIVAELAVKAFVAAFAVGFLFMLWRALVKDGVR
ncbi:MAG TPA: hypothetical protein VFV95_19200 [Vicinamibacterales bacterium]|nr:hypothetical protein [Vicinamibacterales bacterium]